MTLSQARLKELLAYDPATGIFVWKPRPVRIGCERQDKWWNTKWAHQQAGTISQGYVKIWLGARDGGQLPAHRLAFLYMKGRRPPEVDHINGVRDDNRWINLRPATRSQNLANGRHKSPYKGAFKLPGGRWRARIFIRSKAIHLGCFDTRREAVAAYREAATKHFGEYHR